MKQLLVANDWRGLAFWALLATMLRLPPCFSADLSLDETWTWYLTAQLTDAVHPLEVWRVGIDAPLFVAINFAMAKLFGLSVLALRLPQVVCGVAAVVLVRRLLGRLVSPGLATAATALTAFSPFLVYYSLEARPYSQLFCCTMGFALAWVEGQDRRLWTRRLLLAALTMLSIASHYYAVAFFGAFYAAVFIEHARKRDPGALRRDFVTGLLTLLASAPLLLHPLQRLATLGVEYWKMTQLGFAVVLSEQLWFLGLNYVIAPRWVPVASGAILALWALPIVVAWRRRALPMTDPLSGWMGFLPQALVSTAALFGPSFVFYPRGFIASTPLLFVLWVRALAALSWQRTALAVYLGLCLLPLLAGTFRIALADHEHPYFGDRRVMREIARQVDAVEREHDVLLVHQWWLAQFYYYYTRHPSRVRALGGTPETLLRHSGLDAALVDLAAVPSEARVMLVLNRFAEHTDPSGEVVARLKRSRPLLRELPCLEAAHGASIYCSRMLLFGAASQGR